MIDEDFEEIMKEQNQYIAKLEAKLANASDRIQGLEELLWAAEKDANEAEAYAEELEDKLSESEALLAKAVDALGEAIYLLDPDEEDIAKETGLHLIVTTYAELTGGKDE